MWPLLTGLITGGASLLGGMFSSQTSAANTQEQIASQEKMQQQSEEFNASQSQISRDYQTSMSNTAYQRASSDMKAAGLNPAMMFGSGSAAGTPSGSTASIGTPTVPMSQKTSPLAGLGDAAMKGVSSAISAQTMDKMIEEVANLKVDRARQQAETVFTGAKSELTGKESITESERARLLGAEAKLKELGVEPHLLSAEEARHIREMGPDAIKIGARAGWIGDKASKAIEPVTDLVSSALGAKRLFKGAAPFKDFGFGDTGITPGGIRDRALRDVFNRRYYGQ